MACGQAGRAAVDETDMRWFISSTATCFYQTGLFIVIGCMRMGDVSISGNPTSLNGSLRQVNYVIDICQ
jgi:hypothetical protein